jgi:aquaporin Z
MSGEGKVYAAEMLGTFALVLFGCGSAVIAGAQIGFLGISLAFGVTVMVMVYAIGHISGCHINPAISISMLAAGKLSGKDTVFYVIMQCIGAIMASAVLYLIAIGQPDYSIEVNGLGQNGFDTHSPGGYALPACFVAEVVLTMMFLLVIFGCTSRDAPKGFAGISIGMSLVLIHLMGIPITGTSVNPARSLGPALFVGGDAMTQLWLFWVAPIIGGILAAFVWRAVFAEEKFESTMEAEMSQLEARDGTKKSVECEVRPEKKAHKKKK